MKSAFTTRLQQASVGQPLQVMAQRGGRQVYVSLDLASRHPVVTRLHDKPQDCQAYGVTERAQLFGVSVQLRGHGYF